MQLRHYIAKDILMGKKKGEKHNTWVTRDWKVIAAHMFNMADTEQNNQSMKLDSLVDSYRQSRARSGPDENSQISTEF